jgi:transketolase
VVWLEMLRRQAGPAGIALTRQNIPVFERGAGAASGDEFASADLATKGAYVLADAANGEPDVILIGTGSEVQLAVEAREALAADGIQARVVSAPSLEWFAEQDEAYRESVLPKSVKARVSVEAGTALSWRGIVGDTGRSVSIEHFGASADYKTLFQKFGITAEAVIAAARETIKENNA